MLMYLMQNYVLPLLNEISVVPKQSRQLWTELKSIVKAQSSS